VASEDDIAAMLLGMPDERQPARRPRQETANASRDATTRAAEEILEKYMRRLRLPAADAL
jgi:hypothetical protein